MAVIIHIVELYGERFKSIETYGVVEQISRKYAQYHDTSGATATSGGEAIDRYVMAIIILIADINNQMELIDGALGSRKLILSKKITLMERKKKIFQQILYQPKKSSQRNHLNSNAAIPQTRMTMNYCN